ncbi:MAG: zinc-binding dehydrogenase [Candidatus Marinimicrobia bacterium]|nr:zinc-binding dehydrogenase [Candidatus Neomarinimicrobiota bacterium]
MKAFQIKSPEEYAFIEQDLPMPGSGELLLKTRNVGFCGTDLNIYRGTNPLVSYPRITGHEIAATIESVEEHVPDNLQPGMNVTVYPGTNCGECSACLNDRPNACKNNEIYGVQRDGAMLEYFSAPHDKIFVSETLSLEELALVEPLAVGVRAVERGEITEKDTVAVFGSGMIGLSVIGAAAAKGAEVIAIDIDDEKLEVANRAGARHLVNSSKENLHERLQKLTGGHGPMVTVEAIGIPETYRAAVEEVAFTGRVVYIGYAKEDVAFTTQLFVKKELDIRGSRNSTQEDFGNALKLLESGQMPVKDIISKVVPFDQSGGALVEWNANPQKYTKIQVSFDE